MTLDKYTLRARVAPALLLALPAALAVWATEPTGWSGLSAAFLTEGAIAAGASLVRNAGRKKQVSLLARWPECTPEGLLSHTTKRNPLTLRRRHTRLRELLPDVRIPTAEDESKDPAAAKLAYQACCDFLRSRTRDKEKFPLVFEENCNYGFARNVLAIRPWGILVATFGAVAVFVRLYELASDHQPIPMVQPVIAATNTILLLLWIFKFRPDWVKEPAEAYSVSLYESIDRVE